MWKFLCQKYSIDNLKKEANPVRAYPKNDIRLYTLAFLKLQSLFCATTTTSKTPIKIPQKHRLNYLKNTD